MTSIRCPTFSAKLCRCLLSLSFILQTKTACWPCDNFSCHSSTSSSLSHFRILVSEVSCICKTLFNYIHSSYPVTKSPKTRRAYDFQRLNLRCINLRRPCQSCDTMDMGPVILSAHFSRRTNAYATNFLASLLTALPSYSRKTLPNYLPASSLVRNTLWFVIFLHTFLTNNATLTASTFMGTAGQNWVKMSFF